MKERRMWVRSLRLAIVAVTLAAAPAVRSQSDPASIPAARDTLAKWVETQQLISKEKRDWQQGRELLRSRIAQVKSETEAVRERLTATRAEHASVDASRAETLGETRRLDDVTKTVGQWLGDHEQGLRDLKGRLPEPLLQKVEPLYSRMPANAADTKIAIAERFQNVVGILNEINKFNGEITMINEVRTLASGKPAEVRTVYVGLAQAYFVSTGGEAGIGRPAADGWQWTAANDLAPRISEVVEVLQNKAKPSFIPLPVKVQ
jgi:septal ring factor EnvC (AmiA/AmiB activator)